MELPVKLIRPRLFFGETSPVGPGKIDVLMAVHQTGSISAAARACGLQYKRAWTMLDDIRQTCGTDVIESTPGGAGGGGARLTAFGSALIKHYQDIEAACDAAAAPHLKALSKKFQIACR